MTTSTTIASVFSDVLGQHRFGEMDEGRARAGEDADAHRRDRDRDQQAEDQRRCIERGHRTARSADALPSLKSQRRSWSSQAPARPASYSLVGMTSISGGSSPGAPSAGSALGSGTGFHRDAFTALDHIGRRLYCLTAADHAEKTRPLQAIAMYGPCLQNSSASPQAAHGWNCSPLVPSPLIGAVRPSNARAKSGTAARAGPSCNRPMPVQGMQERE